MSYFCRLCQRKFTNLSEFLRHFKQHLAYFNNFKELEMSKKKKRVKISVYIADKLYLHILRNWKKYRLREETLTTVLKIRFSRMWQEFGVSHVTMTWAFKHLERRKNLKIIEKRISKKKLTGTTYVVEFSAID